MKVLDYKKFACFDYESKVSMKDDFELGDIVVRYPDPEYDELDAKPEIGVILQVHQSNEFRTDMFGNCCSSEIELATKEEIEAYRPELLEFIK